MIVALPTPSPARAPGAIDIVGSGVARSRSISMTDDRAPASLVTISSSTDAELVGAVVARDVGAFEELYRRHGGAVFGLARRVLRRDDLAEDVTQDVFVRLWNQPSRFDPTRGGLRSFLQREAHSRSIERVRSEEARIQRERRANPVEPQVSTLESEVMASIRSDDVRHALDALDPPVRSAIVLAYYGGLSYRQVAERLGEPEGTVKSRIRAGLARLAELLSDGSEVER